MTRQLGQVHDDRMLDSELSYAVRLKGAIIRGDETAVMQLLMQSGGDTDVHADYPRAMLDAIMASDSSNCHDMLGRLKSKLFSREERGAFMDTCMQLSRSEFNGLLKSISYRSYDSEQAFGLRESYDGGYVKFVREFFSDVFERNNIVKKRGELYKHPLTALQLAIEQVHPNHAIVKALLAHGADINARNPFGESVVFTAMRLGHYDIAHLLLNHPEMDISSRNNMQQTALHVAACLCEQSPDGSSLKNAKLIDLIKLLSCLGCDVSQGDVSGYTPLFSAMHSQDERLLNCLLDVGVDVDRIDSDGATDVMRAIVYIKRGEMIEAVIDASSNVDVAAPDILKKKDGWCDAVYDTKFGGSAIEVAMGRVKIFGPCSRRTNFSALIHLLKKSNKSNEEKLAIIVKVINPEVMLFRKHYSYKGLNAALMALYPRYAELKMQWQRQRQDVDELAEQMLCRDTSWTDVEAWFEQHDIKFSSIVRERLSGCMSSLRRVSDLFEMIESHASYKKEAQKCVGSMVDEPTKQLLRTMFDKELAFRRRRVLLLLRDGRRLGNDQRLFAHGGGGAGGGAGAAAADPADVTAEGCHSSAVRCD